MQTDERQRRVEKPICNYCGGYIEEMYQRCPALEKGVSTVPSLPPTRRVPAGSSTTGRVPTSAPSAAPPTAEFVIDVTTRTLRRWMEAATDELRDEHDESGWQYVGMHDLRRTWATQLRSADVDAMVVCDWGGWNDLDTFLDHYHGTYTPESRRRDREKVGWL